MFSFEKIFKKENICLERLQGEHLTLQEQEGHLITLREELMRTSGVGFHNNALSELNCRYYSTDNFYITKTISEKIYQT